MWLSHSVADEQQALLSGGLAMVRAHSTGSTANRRHHIHAPDVVPLRRKGKLSPRHVGDHWPGRAPSAFTHSGCTNAPFPAESLAATLMPPSKSTTRAKVDGSALLIRMIRSYGIETRSEVASVDPHVVRQGEFLVRPKLVAVHYSDSYEFPDEPFFIVEDVTIPVWVYDCRKVRTSCQF